MEPTVELSYEYPSISRWIEPWSRITQRPLNSLVIDSAQAKLRQSVVRIALQVPDSRDQITDIIRQARKCEFKSV